MTTAFVNPLYSQALKLSEKLPASASNISRVARETSDEAARWAFSQWSLRERAAAKFERAGQMLFDRDGLEMATHEAVAAYHASFFPNGELVEDLTVGIGADLIALAARGPAVGFEIAPERVEMARHNLEVYDLRAEVLAHSFEMGRSGEARSPYFFADPARRSAGKRSIDPNDFSPNPSSVIESFPNAKLGLIKLTPMLPDDFLESFGGRLEFVSYGGECREALIAVGSEAQAGRFAVQLESKEQLPASDEQPYETDAPSEFLYEADPAAIRAHAIGTLCDRHSLTPLGDSGGYLTGEEEIQSPWLKSFRVLGSGRFDLSSLKRMLRDFDAATPVLKQRLANQDLDKLRKQLLSNGSREVAVAFYPVGKSLRQVVLEPLR